MSEELETITSQHAEEMQAMDLKYLCDLRKLKLAHKNELELLESDPDALNDLVADFFKKSMNHKPFFHVDNQSVYFEKEHLRFEVENATHERVVERV